jgi:hypothetical protein
MTLKTRGCYINGDRVATLMQCLENRAARSTRFLRRKINWPWHLHLPGLIREQTDLGRSAHLVQRVMQLLYWFRGPTLAEIQPR